ncbi:hypothetical protein yc1106_03945 [Curvularia clavata]|uniref:MutL C-terminal dimerisation domain-containing protein n=1 Tax=Curvularia clavata TaxID=95742 RepID=A0A9Q9DSQ3_CURCL|nr:hypothetical protein yc1106_03945 [Curvularia clavata]
MNSITPTNPRHAMATPSGRSILPLPDDVVAQITSSTAIVSLTAVVLELLKNSLDAKATRVDAAVDFTRGACVVEDNGLGISPREFAEDGGLGKLYCTSKYHANEPVLGCHGTFLASLAAMSLLTIASHHHEYRSHNAVTFHHSRVVERLLPASAHHEIHGSSGTRVTVRNLFGNMPVRVKQRSIVTTQKTEHDKLWERLKHDIVGLLLGWQGSVFVRIRDGDNKTVLNLNTSSPSVSVDIGKSTAEAQPTQLHSLLNVLTQADYIAIDEWSSWVPASASTSAISVKGAISLNPAPNKHVQFISLGPRPLSPDCGHNELFDHVNRIFALSSFGTIDDDAVVDEQEKRRRQADGRFKKEGYTNRQLKTRKDVDRYPMFHLRISLAEDDAAAMSEDQFVGNRVSLQNTMDIIEAMLKQWLVVHHFQPRQSRKRREVPNTASRMFSDAAESDTSALTSQSKKLKSNSSGAVSRKRKRSKDSASHDLPGKPHRGAFAEWSRIKSGKSEFFNLPTRRKSKDQTSRNGHDRIEVQHPTEIESPAPLSVKPIAQGAFSGHQMQDRPTPVGDDPNTSEKENDDMIPWKDPSTGKTYLLNARTGCVLPGAQSQLSTDSFASLFRTDQRPASKSIRLPNRPSTAATKETPWLDEVLRNWENPVFKPSEQRIEQIPIHGDGFSHNHDFAKHNCSRLTDTAFDTNTLSSASRLSKESLKNAKVISQVDNKFILVKMQNASLGPNQKINDMLVLVDQHAADERVQVESLFSQLCTPLPSIAKPYQSQLGHNSRVATTTLEKPLTFAISAQEAYLLTTHAARFAAWGILYDISSSLSQSAQKDSKRESLVSVTTLPPAVAQRCISDPKILISLLRSTVWEHAEHDRVVPLVSRPLLSEKGKEEKATTVSTPETNWVTSLSTCPPALIQLINSRACRSALMFNDELSLEACNELVAKLAQCVFPFMCAHGRPSMVPIVGLGERGGGVVGGFAEYSGGEERGFVQAWREWRNR